MSKVKKNLKTYTIEHFENENCEKVFSRTNDGFNPFELIGLCEMTIRDIRDQMVGVVKADVIKRQIIEKEYKGMKLSVIECTDLGKHIKDGYEFVNEENKEVKFIREVGVNDDTYLFSDGFIYNKKGLNNDLISEATSKIYRKNK